jgi:hypothetical protein
MMLLCWLIAQNGLSAANEIRLVSAESDNNRLFFQVVKVVGNVLLFRMQSSDRLATSPTLLAPRDVKRTKRYECKREMSNGPTSMLGELSTQEESRICKLLSGHRDRALPSELHWVTSTKFKTPGWTQCIIPEGVALVLLLCRTKEDPRTDISACVADYCRKVGIPCLRLRKHSEMENFFDTNIGITFHPCFLDLKTVLDPERRLDLLAASTAARPLSPLITNKTWAHVLCGLGHREQLEKFIALRQDRIIYELTNNVAGEIAHVSKLVDQKKSRLVLISASAWMQRFDETLSLIEMCKKHQVPVFLVHDKQFCFPPQFPAIFCLKNKYAITFEIFAAGQQRVQGTTRTGDRTPK